MAVHAVIDIGSNSAKLIAGRAGAAGIEVLHEESRITRLARDLHRSGELGDQARERSLDAIAALLGKARALGAASIQTVGTEALRRAEDRDLFAGELQARCGLPLRILSGDEEARLSHAAAAALLALPESPLCVCDVGGGSTDLSFGRGGTSERRVSLPLGCRRPSEEILLGDPPREAELRALAAHVDAQLGPAFRDPPPASLRLIGVGGTATTLCAVQRKLSRYEVAAVQGRPLSLAEVERQIGHYAALDLSARREVIGLNPERADVILAGAAIFAGLMRAAGVSGLTVCHGGLRYALLEAACAASPGS